MMKKIAEIPNAWKQEEVHPLYDSVKVIISSWSGVKLHCNEVEWLTRLTYVLLCLEYPIQGGLEKAERLWAIISSMPFGNYVISVNFAG